MRVLLVHNRYRRAAPSGENRVVDQEAEALAAAGHEVTRFERHSDDIEAWPAPRRALVPAMVVRNPVAGRALHAEIDRVRPDVVHVHNTFPLLSPSVVGAAAAAGTPVVVTVHNYKLLCASGDLFRDGRVCHDCRSRRVAWPGLVHGCYRGSAAASLPVVAAMALNRSLWRRAPSAFIFISEAQRRLHEPLGLPADRTFVKYNLVPGLPAGEGRGRREPLVCYLGRLDEAKGISVLLEAWDRLRADRTAGHLRLVVAGDGPLGDRVRAWAATRDDADAVGTLDRQACRSLLARARAAVLPSAWEETFGLVAVEAMASGTPPVAAGHGSFPELIDDGRDGVLFPPGDPTALASVLAAVADDPARFAAYGEAARRTWSSRFDPQDNLRQLLAVYRFAIERPAE